MTATPAVVQPGHVVRVRMGGHAYSSPVMSPELARAEFDRVAKALVECAASFRTFPFTTVDDRDVAIRGRNVSAVEVGPPPARRDQPAPQPPTCVHVHLGCTDDAVDLDEPVPVVPSTPTPLDLAGRRRSPR